MLTKHICVLVYSIAAEVRLKLPSKQILAPQGRKKLPPTKSKFSQRTAKGSGVFSPETQNNFLHKNVSNSKL
jgi:hypothetical protein